MRVLTIYAHHNPNSFCHAVLERFSAGLADAGHTHQVVDLYAIGFDPVFREHDAPNWIDDSVPDDVLELMDVQKSLIRSAHTAVTRFLMRRWMGDASPRELIRRIRQRGGPSDVKVQQEQVAAAEALVFISPVFFVGFPAILKGWIERVFSLGFAFDFEARAWRGDIRGRIPLLKHKKALIINTTIFDKRSYDDGLAAPIAKLVDEYCLHYPGIETVQHEYFFAVHGADVATRQAYLDRAYILGREF
jgi:NAD(P)H dehydrogenase (quinone)